MEFALKMYSLITVFICYWIYYYFVKINEWNYSIGWIFIDILFSIVSMLVIILFSTFDALQLQLYHRIIGGFAIIIMLTVYSIYYNLQLYVDGDDSVIKIPFIGIGISLLSNAGSSLQILLIFAWKQTIVGIFRQRRCSSIKYTPYFRWIDDGDIESKLADIQCMDTQQTATKTPSIKIDTTLVEPVFIGGGLGSNEGSSDSE